MTDAVRATSDGEPAAPTKQRPARGDAAAVRRSPRALERVEREAAARRLLFAASLGGFVAVFGLIAAMGKPTPVVGAEEPPSASLPAAPDRVLAEAPIKHLVGAGDGRETIVRIVAPEPVPVVRRVRTRAS